MKTTTILAAVFIGALAFTTNSVAADRPTRDEARAIAEEAYVFGFAIVEHYKALWAYGVEPKSPKYSGFNALRNETRLYGPEDTAVVSPNNDTLYTTALMDLRAEPVVVHVPDVPGRYYSFMLVDMVTDNFAYVGTRATGASAETYAVTGPGWKDHLPKGVVRISSPAWLVLGIGRTESRGTDDLTAVKTVQAGYKMMPLSQFTGQASPPPAPRIDFPPLLDAKTATAEQFIRYLNFMLQWQALPAVEFPLLEKLSRIGIAPGRSFEAAELSPEVFKAVEEGMAAGRAKVSREADNLGMRVNGWNRSPSNAGEFGQDYLTRSAAAWKYIYINSAVEAMYPTANVDGNGKPLDGENRYVLTFAKDGLPPVNCFWSVTIYDAKTQAPVRNPIERYSIGDRTPGFKPAADGSLTIYIQNESPGEALKSNWLPTPRGPFYVILRTYGPKPELLDGSYQIPPIRMAAEAATLAATSEARAIAKEAFIYAYAPIQGYQTLYNQTHNAAFPGYIGGFGRYRHYARVATPADKDIVSPNNDTPYSWAWLDLRREPVVLKLPAVPKGRYIVFQWFDLYTHNFAYVGVRSTGFHAGNYLFAGPNWKGDVPQGITKVFRSETDIIGTLTRTSIDGESDVPNVRALQQQYVLMPLSEFAGQRPPPPAPDVEFHQWDEQQALSAGFIGYLNFLLQFCQPIHPSEAAMMERYARIGIGAGKPFEPAKVDPVLLAAIEQGAQDGLAAIEEFAAQQTSSANLFGTREFLGENLAMKRNAAAMLGIYANSKEEAYYAAYQLDGEGKPLTAKTDRYILRFPPGELPQVNFFWSLTMYSVPDRFLVANPINRYSIGNRTAGLKLDADGGLTIYIQAQSPGVDKESNWLPAPSGPFFMAMRMYGPGSRILSGDWKEPALKRAD